MRRLPRTVFLLFPADYSPARPVRGVPGSDCCQRVLLQSSTGRLRVCECILEARHPGRCNPWPVAPLPRELECSRCSSGPGEPCSSPAGLPTKTHTERLELAARTPVYVGPANRDIPGPECHTTGGEELAGRLVGVCQCGGSFDERMTLTRPELIAKARGAEHVAMTRCQCGEPLPLFLEAAP